MDHLKSNRNTICESRNRRRSASSGELHGQASSGPVPGAPLESRGMSARLRFAVASAALPLLIGASGCGFFRQAAVSTMVPVIEQTVETLYRDRDVETIGEGIPGNLLLLRGLCESDPGNEDLWTLTTQLTFYYAVGYVEDRDPERAVLLYEEGYRHGRRALERKDWFTPDAPLDRFEEGLAEADEDDVPLLFWTLANWTKWISLKLDEPAVVAQLPAAEAALERTLALDPGYFLGMPHLMRGTLEATKPVLMGGDPEEARSHFERAFEISGGKLLIFHVFYAQYYWRSRLDEEQFVGTLERVLQAEEGILPEYRLLNEVARRKAQRLMERRDELF
ncbi:MAG: hypothetical protein GF346_11920 [Candidatus Eisenbacteria bacterium]|nr:hypothetical protein [Candidatus Latescibacterota bacterium]MBD3303143.1 hypothetical protein [Candidatus Eisenbacteria bacterium]